MNTRNIPKHLPERRDIIGLLGEAFVAFWLSVYKQWNVIKVSTEGFDLLARDQTGQHIAISVKGRARELDKRGKTKKFEPTHWNAKALKNNSDAWNAKPYLALVIIWKQENQIRLYLMNYETAINHSNPIPYKGEGWYNLNMRDLEKDSHVEFVSWVRNDKFVKVGI
ncbi:MAG: hypothetical protein Q7T16_00155 [Candidatus Burarchaeum sp.]|nr:hypothetical protein [Candidatus Burarchaeum sp.]MDO8339051.1 hypothetical protein [Candidatus Burarchaeum sp.]